MSYIIIIIKHKYEGKFFFQTDPFNGCHECQIV